MAKRILALDGGGIRGIVTLAFLLRLETLLSERAKMQVKLCNAFDLIGGTSTGAIISTALALGYQVSDIVEFYRSLGPKVFHKSRWRVAGFQSLFDGKRLRQELQSIIGDETLESDRLTTGLAIISKRIDTGGAWILTNNPKSKYWRDPEDNSYIGNRHYKLVDIVRASTAAPHYFEPESIAIAEDEPPGLFVDGGVTPHNNPSLALFQLATISDYGYCWPVGQANLSILSIGTGSFRMRLDAQTAKRTPSAMLAVKALTGLIQDNECNTLTMMQLLGSAIAPVSINSELGSMLGNRIVDPLFTFQRYDMKLEAKWLYEVLGDTVSPKELAKLQQIDLPEMMPRLWELAEASAEKLIEPDHIIKLFSNKLDRCHE